VEGSGPHLIHSSLGPAESTSQTPSRSVHPFLQDSRSLQTGRQTDRPRYFVRSNRSHLASAAMRPNDSRSGAIVFEEDHSMQTTLRERLESSSFILFSERELTCYRPSVCLSSVTFVRTTQAVQSFGNISTALGTLAIL